MKTLIAALAVVLAAASASRADDLTGTYLCSPIASGGVAYHNGAWFGTKFNLAPPHIVSIEPSGSGADEYDIQIARVGAKDSTPCLDDWKPVTRQNKSFFCNALVDHWAIGLNDMRYRYAHLAGYGAPESDAGSDTPLIEIGTCKRIAG